MFKKITALLLMICIVFCMSACDLDVSNSKNASSVEESSAKTELDTDDIFYSDEELEVSSKAALESSKTQKNTTSSALISNNETTSSKTSSKNSTSSKTATSKNSTSSKKTTSKVATSSKKTTTSKVTVPDETETEGNLVWIPTNGGTKYHTHSSCSNMKNPKEVTKSTAESNGFTPCKKCYS